MRDQSEPIGPAVSMVLGSGGSGNRIIQGDNLEVLAWLEAVCSHSVRCIYLDPPYNNGEQYAHYLDDQGHDIWLTELRERLRLLWPLLADNGSIWISIDDREVHYLKVLCDELFGRSSFVSTIIWNHRKSRENRRVFSNNHEYILVYAKNPVLFAATRNDLPLTGDVLDRYKNPDDDPRGSWQSVSLNVQAGHAVASQFYEVTSPTGAVHRPPRGRCWAFSQERMLREIEDGRVWFGKSGNSAPRYKKYLQDVAKGLTPQTLWNADEVGATADAKKHILRLFPEAYPFDTPKPETLLSRVLHIATEPGDLVLDAYLGSGTTAAVAHKMHRRYIGIERGEHAATLCAERIRSVIEGEQGGVSPQVGWVGGGGCDFELWEPNTTITEVAI